MNTSRYPIFDLHCDLLSYLAYRPGADPMNADAIGCAIPNLIEGNVKWQVLAIYAGVEEGSAAFGHKQSLVYKELLDKYQQYILPATELPVINSLPGSERVGVIAAIENASGFCEEDQALDKGFEQLEAIINNVDRLLYISLTHHSENRFGGGNYCHTGLKEDGKVLLEYLNNRGIAVDLSHTCDALALDILDHIHRKGLRLPVMASHSNFRAVFDHPRNIRDEVVAEVVGLGGVIGVNFLRAFLNDRDPEALTQHIMYGMSGKGADHLAFGADFFYTKEFPDPSREPFYYPTESDASKYPSILASLSSQLTKEQMEGLSYKNIMAFINRNWQS